MNVFGYSFQLKSKATESPLIRIGEPWFVVAWDGQRLEAGSGVVHIWDSYAPSDQYTAAMEGALRRLGLEVVLHRTMHQTDGWSCGYFSLHYVHLLAAQGEGTDLNQVDMPDIHMEFYGQVQAVVNK